MYLHPLNSTRIKYYYNTPSVHDIWLKWDAGALFFLNKESHHSSPLETLMSTNEHYSYSHAVYSILYT